MAAATPSKGSRSTTSANRRSSRNSAQATSPHAFEKTKTGKERVKRKGKITKSKYYDSDALDEDSDFDANEDDEEEEKPQKSKRKRTSGAGKQSKTPSPRKRRRKAGDEDADEEEEDFELKEGQEIVGEVVQAPKTGQRLILREVPPGQISKNTLDFLEHLRMVQAAWCVTYPIQYTVLMSHFFDFFYRLAEKEFKDFVDAFTEVLTEVDPH
ncbi:hypothetical protein BT96DRAFT_964663, partial [Gymnopus androsaceus JB14]